MADPYEPAEGSLGAQVLQYFRTQPDVLELSQQQIADLFPPTKFASVPGCLMTPMQHGLLGRVRNAAGVLVYRRGPKLTGATLSAAAACGAAETTTRQPGRPRPANGSPVQRLPAIDLATLQVVTDRPLPVPQAPKRHSRYDAIFERLQQVGASTLLPRAYLGALKQAALKYSKRTGRRVMAYALPDDPDQCGVWRLPEAAGKAPATSNTNSTRITP